jgi:hypothetical protein
MTMIESPALSIERRAILTVALSRHIMYLQASIADLQGYDTPSAVEATKDMETELKEAETWLQEVKDAK